MLKQYKNIEQINSATESVSGERISKAKTNFFSYGQDTRVVQVPELSSQASNVKIELHAYAGDSWITGNHQIQLNSKIPQYRNRDRSTVLFPGRPLAIDLYNEFAKLKLTSGNFRIVVNFLKDLIGSYDEQYLRIDEISPDRTEIRLKAIDDENQKYLQELTKYILLVNPTSTKNTFYKTYLLNFSRNKTATIVNSVVVGDYVYIKLYEPLDDTINVDFKCWVVQELKPAYIDKVAITPEIIQKQYNKLANPNWYANAVYNTTTETGFQHWNDLLGSSTQTSQQIVDAYFSGSLSGIKLNIDYSDFNNFVFYSSAAERLANFKYKIELLEYYTSQSLVVSGISGSVSTTNIADFTTNKNNLIGGFDAFEQYLYYESSSKLTTNNISNQYAHVTTLTGSFVTPVPKLNTTRPYALAPVSSSLFTTWYDSLLTSASLYDTLNYNALIYGVPEFIRYDATSDGITTFVNMLGHHYDILYTYINHMTQINKREENPKLGMPNELLYSVAKQFGWNLTDGNQSQDLWQYVLGTNEAGSPLTGSNSVGYESVPGREMTYTIWRRIVNNLPLLLKSKGTKRSIQALLSCYGIPQSMISINEYGGPRIDRAPVYEKLNFDYALDFIGTTTGVVEIPYQTTPKSIELRFRTDNVITNPTMPSSMELIQIQDGSGLNVNIEFTSGTKGILSLNGNTTDPIEMFDGGWLSVLITERGGNLFATVKRSKYGKIIAETSTTASGDTIPSGPGTIYLGSSFGYDRLKGQLQELRLWNVELNQSYFNNHVKAPGAYNSADPYNELIFRLPLTQKINHNNTGSLFGVQPKASAISASFTNWSSSTPYDSIEETYYYDAISLGAGTFDDNKIRLEDNELVGTLDIKTRAEQSQYDKAPVDSKKLGVYFSPQTMINEDIIAQLGFTELDQYIGDPGQTESNSYPKLIQAANSYWKKYSDSNDINAYISIFAMFDLSFFRQLEQLLPARTDKLTGLLIQPNILERSKATILPNIQKFDSSYSASLANMKPVLTSDYLQYTGSISDKILTLSAIDDDQLQMYLTASTSDKYDGTPYSYKYLLHSGSTWITASTPYWMSEGELPVLLTGIYSMERLAKPTTFLTASGAGTSSGVRGNGNIPSNLTRFSGSRVDFQDYLPTGIGNQRYNGCKLNSPAFNVNSTQTIDGGPTVEWRSANPNQLVYQTYGDQGSFVLV
jgi:hypothetical protein